MLLPPERPWRPRPIRRHKAYWPCVYASGRRKRVRGARLLAGRTVSCGLWRADGKVRKAARRKKAGGDHNATLPL